MEPNTAQHNYLQSWRNLMCILLGWPELRTDAWARKVGYYEELANGDSMIYHRPPQYWIVSHLMQDVKLGTLSKLQKVTLSHQLVDAMVDEYNFCDARRLPALQSELRSRVNAVLAKYSTQLPAKISAPILRVQRSQHAEHELPPRALVELF